MDNYAITTGLVKRQCKDNGRWGRVLDIKNCSSIDLLNLQNTSRLLEQFYTGGDEIDYTQSSSILDSLSVGRELHILTNTTTPLAPRNVNIANDILRAVLRYIYMNTFCIHWCKSVSLYSEVKMT